jgi:hypothetical protein
MKKAATKNPTSINHSLAPLVEQVRRLVQSARSAAAASVNSLQVRTNFEIGRRIVEHEQQGAARAKYGKELLEELSLRLTEELGSGFSELNLRSFRLFYRTYQERSPQIWQKPSAKLPGVMISQKPSGKLPVARICQTASGKSSAAIAQKPSAQLSSPPPSPFTLSWSHHVLLLTIKNPEERQHLRLPIPALPAFQGGPETAPHRMDCGDQR